MLDREQITNWDRGVETTDRGPWAATRYGRRIYLTDPRPDELHLDDVAHHLSMVNRFGGATKHPYNVAQHSVVTWKLALRRFPGRIQLQKWALAHDVPEFILGDMIRPLKQEMPQYKVLEHLHMEAVKGWLGLEELDADDAARLREIDDIAVVTEREILLPDGQAWPGMPDADKALGEHYVRHESFSISAGRFRICMLAAFPHLKGKGE